MQCRGNRKASLVLKLVLRSNLIGHCVEDNKFRVVFRVKNLNIYKSINKKYKMANCHSIYHESL